MFVIVKRLQAASGRGLVTGRDIVRMWMTEWKTDEKGAAISSTALRIDMVLLFFAILNIIQFNCHIAVASRYNRGRLI